MMGMGMRYTGPGPQPMYFHQPGYNPQQQPVADPAISGSQTGTPHGGPALAAPSETSARIQSPPAPALNEDGSPILPELTPRSSSQQPAPGAGALPVIEENPYDIVGGETQSNGGDMDLTTYRDNLVEDNSVLDVGPVVKSDQEGSELHETIGHPPERRTSVPNSALVTTTTSTMMAPQLPGSNLLRPATFVPPAPVTSGDVRPSMASPQQPFMRGTTPRKV